MVINSPQQANAILDPIRARKKVVCANGSFDVLHIGHVRSLREARALGDILIVLLNSDSSVRLYKGPSRPIIPQGERAEMLSALRCVDYVVLFDEVTPKKALGIIKPDVYASGNAWGRDCIERDVVERNGGTMHLLAQHGFSSTSELVRRIADVSEKPEVRAVFFDRDNTINDDAGYTHRIEDFKFLPRCMEAFKLLNDTDYKKIIITNQSGIGRGYYTEEDYQKLTTWMLAQFSKERVVIDAVYHCPHTPSDKCVCRKPMNGLILKAAQDFGVSLAKSWMIGDKAEDVVVGKETNMKTIKIGSPMPSSMKLEPNFYAEDLFQAVEYIIRDRPH